MDLDKVLDLNMILVLCLYLYLCHNYDMFLDFSMVHCQDQEVDLDYVQILDFDIGPRLGPGLLPPAGMYLALDLVPDQNLY